MAPNRNTLLLILMVPPAIVAVIGAIVVAVMMWKTEHPAMLPTDTLVIEARSYLQALEDGDATKALELSGDLTSDMMYNGGGLGAQQNLLTDEVLGGAVERIHDVQIVRTFTAREAQIEEFGPERAGSVSITYELDGRSHQAELMYDYPDGHWQLVQGLTSQLWVYTNAGGDPVPFSISGVLSTDESDCRTRDCWRFQMFPAVYTVQPIVDPSWTESEGYEVCDDLSCWYVEPLPDGDIPAQDVVVVALATAVFTVDVHIPD